MSSDIHSVLVGETWRRAGMVARASGNPIVSGTINYYLLAKSGVNAGKWWKDSDQTWDVSETANAMTHDADGTWTIELSASPFADGVLYVEYAKESGNLHIPAEGRLLRGQVVVDTVVKTGYTLASDGLDSIAITAPTGVASTFREMVVQVWRRFFRKSTLTSTQLKTYADDGTTVLTTQAVSDDSTTQDQGAAT